MTDIPQERYEISSDPARLDPARMLVAAARSSSLLADAGPEAGVALGHVMNRMGPRSADDPRGMALSEAVYEAL